MTDPNRLLNEIRIASPCSASWDEMAGDDTVRFCSQCRLNVYNLSSMTAAAAALLVDRAEGRICVRLYKRHDGTVLTEDCPVGLRAKARRMLRAAGMALTAVVGLFSSAGVRAASGDGEPRGDHRVKMGKIARPVTQGVEVLVTATAEHGLSLDGAEVVLTNLGTGETLAAELGEDAQYRFHRVPPGVYTLTVTAPGYEDARPRTVRVANAPLRLTVDMLEVEVLMGEIVAEPQG